MGTSLDFARYRCVLSREVLWPTGNSQYICLKEFWIFCDKFAIHIIALTPFFKSLYIFEFELCLKWIIPSTDHSGCFSVTFFGVTYILAQCHFWFRTTTPCPTPKNHVSLQWSYRELFLIQASQKSSWYYPPYPILSLSNERTKCYFRQLKRC